MYSLAIVSGHWCVRRANYPWDDLCPRAVLLWDGVTEKVTWQNGLEAWRLCSVFRSVTRNTSDENLDRPVGNLGLGQALAQA